MCPVDWTLNAHNEHQCFRFVDEMEEVGYTPERFMHDISITNCVVFPWLRRADPDEIVDMIDEFYATYDIGIFAPSDMNIIRKGLPKYLSAPREAMRRVVTSNYEIVD